MLVSLVSDSADARRWQSLRRHGRFGDEQPVLGASGSRRVPTYRSSRSFRKKLIECRPCSWAHQPKRDVPASHSWSAPVAAKVPAEAASSVQPKP